MESIKIEILNPKALEMIELMAELKLVRISQDPITKLQEYLGSMRSDSAPSLEEITEITESVRSARYAKK